MRILSWCRQLFSSGGPRRTLQQAKAAAAQGDREAQFSLGLRCCLEEGEGRDLAQGVEWYRLAAEQDHLLAQFNLGKMFAAGDGVPKDAAVSRRWMLRSAEGGDAGAQFALGFQCRIQSLDRASTTCGESRVEAYKWLKLSAEQGYHRAEDVCEQVNLGMSREEVDDGNRRVAAFVARLQPA